jgi:hypothetical protein
MKAAKSMIGDGIEQKGYDCLQRYCDHKATEGGAK